MIDLTGARSNRQARAFSRQILTRWQEHALWMLASYSRTGNFKHLSAFARQVHGMRQERLQ